MPQAQMPSLLSIQAWRRPLDKTVEADLEIDPFITAIRTDEISYVISSTYTVPPGDGGPVIWCVQRTRSKSNGSGNIVPFSPDFTDIPDEDNLIFWVTDSVREKIQKQSGRFAQVTNVTIKNYNRKTKAVSFSQGDVVWFNLDHVDRVITDPDNSDYSILSMRDGRLFWIDNLNYLDLFVTDGLEGDYNGTMIVEDPTDPGNGLTIAWETRNMRQTAWKFTANGDGEPL